MEQEQQQSAAVNKVSIDFEDAIRETREVLASASLLLPFASDKLTLTRSKVIFERHSGLQRLTLESIGIHKITNVSASIGPVFGTIHFTHDSPDFPKQVGMFPRAGTIRMKRIILGYVIALQKKLDTDAIPLNKLVPLLTELGTEDKEVR